ncbi:hypothetical protein J6590_023110 [Homalodisca vitripennis]|nr:hypothetical protein J6590_023110 [Homalodisca vitripennis]
MVTHMTKVKMFDDAQPNPMEWCAPSSNAADMDMKNHVKFQGCRSIHSRNIASLTLSQLTGDLGDMKTRRESKPPHS